MSTIDGLPVKPDNGCSHSGTETHTQQFAPEGHIGLWQQPAFPVCNNPFTHIPQDNVTNLCMGQLSDYASANNGSIHSNATSSRVGTDPGSQHQKKGRAQKLDWKCPLLTVKPPNAKMEDSCKVSVDTISKLRYVNSRP